MTYKEAYMQCNTLKELEAEAVKDIGIATMLNPDRIGLIKQACEEVANIKFSEVTT